MKEIECKVNVYLQRNNEISPEEIADKFTEALVQYDQSLFDTVLVDAIDEKIGTPQRKILSAVIDFDELRKSVVDNYNAIINEMRVYYQNCKTRKKSKDDLYGVFLMLQNLKENVEWLLRCDKPLAVELQRVKDAYFFTEPTKEKAEKSKSAGL